MNKKKISIIVEVVIFLGILGIITFAYYYNSNIKKNEEEAEKVGIIKVTDENFDNEVLNSDKTVILEFSSNMCPPCLTMVPTLISIAKNNPDLKVVTMNTSDDDTKNTKEKYEIDATPTILIIKDGVVIKTFLGVTKEETIINEIK